MKPEDPFTFYTYKRVIQLDDEEAARLMHHDYRTDSIALRP